MPSESRTAKQVRAREIVKRLRKAYPDVRCTLDFVNPLQLLISTILAAQCTDERVNIVTKDLYKKYRNAEDFANAPDGELEEAIRSCGFYRQKAKSIRNTCRALIENFDGKVPGSMEDLLQLRGVGRKTANVILGECFRVPGIIVDTHCTRLANRLGFTRSQDAGKIEQDLMKIVPKHDWTLFSHYMVFHGRAVCNARAPRCSQCPIREWCPFPDSAAGKKVAG